MPTLKFIVEAALLAADEPLSVERLQGLFEESQPPSRDALRRAVTELQEDYTGRGIELVEVASGFRIQVRQELAPWVSRLWEERSMRYSRASLETLALIAYRQPITRGEIEEVRGVSVSSAIVKTLQDRGWIKVLGHREVPGRPALYGTTRAFLDYFNLKTLGELPPLAELRDLDAIGKQLDLLDSPVDAPTVASADMPVDAADDDTSADAAADDTSADTSNDAAPDLPAMPETKT